MATIQEFHAYVQSVVAHMPGWEYRESDNVENVPVSGASHTVRELRNAPTIKHTASSGKIYFYRDDYRKKFSANAEHGRRTITNGWGHLGDEFKASAGFSQGRDPKQVARAILAKVAEMAIKAGAELDKREQDQRESRSTMLGTIAKLNASKLLNRKIEKPREHDRSVHFYGKGSTYGQIDEHGKVRLDRISVDADTALRIMAILAEAGQD